MSSIVSFPISVPGKWNISGTFGGYTIKETAQVTEKGSTVQVELEFQDATITVTSPVGTSLVVSNGDTQYTKISTGLDVFNVYIYGEWTVSGTLEGFVINSVSVTVEPDNNYPVQLTIQTATLTVTAPIGVIVSVSGGGQTQQKTSLNGTVVFELTQLDTYTISGTLDNLSTNTVQVQVTDFTSYTATLTIDAATIHVNTITDVAVTIQNGSETYTKVAGESGQVQFLTQTTGEWTVNGVLEGYTFEETSVDVQGMQEYPVDLFPLFATITVTAPDETVVTATNGELQESAFVESGTAVIRIYSFGEWTVSGEKDGLFTNTETVQVSDWIDYPITLTIFVATITVTTPTGTSVTAQNGINQQIKVAQSGDTVVFQVQQTGNWTLSAQFGTQSDSEVVNVTTETNYTARLWVPTIVPTVVTGSVVTAIQSGTTLTETSVSGKVKFYVPSLGEWTVSATLNEQESNTVIVDVQEDRDYPMLLSYEFATITVQTEPNTEVTAQNGAIIITGTSNSNGEVVFEVATMGTWTLSATLYNEFVSTQVDVSTYTNYNVALVAPNLEIVKLDNKAISSSKRFIGRGGAHVGSYAFFAGGWNNTNVTANIYTTNLVTIVDEQLIYTGDTLPTQRYGACGGQNNNYAIFAGGAKDAYATPITSVIAFDANKIKSTATPLSSASLYATNASSNLHTMFCGSSTFSRSAIDLYDSDLVHNVLSLSVSRAKTAGSSNGYDVIFSGGRINTSEYSSVTDCFNESLVESVLANLSVSRWNAIGFSVGGKMVIAGGGNADVTYIGTVDVYNESLTMTTIQPMIIIKRGGWSTNLIQYAIVGGSSDTDSQAVVAFDRSLTQSLAPPVDYTATTTAATRVGQYAMVATYEGSASDGASYIETYTLEGLS